MIDASVIFQRFTLLLVSQATSKAIVDKKIGGNLTAMSTGNHRGIGGGIHVPET